MKTIWKFELERIFGCEQVIEMPEWHQVLTAQMQGDKLVLWAEVDTEKPKVKRAFIIHGTGHSLDANYDKELYLATVVSGPLVYHIYTVL